MDSVDSPRSAAPWFEAWLQRVAAEPYRVDFYQALRRIESANPSMPRLGKALRPGDEPVRVAQAAELTFAPAPVHSLKRDTGGPPRLMQRIFGLIGPNGPLPMHMTELARERALHLGDHGLQRFLDTLTNRFALLFYRAWADAQPVVGLDRGGDSPFSRRLGSLFGIGSESLTERDGAGDAAKLHFTGHLARQTRDADGLLSWCRSEFDVPVRIEQWQGHWMPLDRQERTQLQTPRIGTTPQQGLGRGAVLGSSVWDVQHKFRIVLGPMPLARYVAFLPDGRDLPRLQAMVRQWVGIEFAWDLTLVLQRRDVPALQLSRQPGRLGRTSWLGRYRRTTDCDDMTLDVESTMGRSRRPPPTPDDFNTRTNP